MRCLEAMLREVQPTLLENEIRVRRLHPTARPPADEHPKAA
jgi:hypothetical protein